PILIDNLPIKIRPNPNALNEIPISNRQKRGNCSATCRLQPKIRNLNLSNRNCKELKIDVTH
ncbi:MAG: hypothetical protein ACRD40_05705, partial [Candidatus Acidiferrales bacterium]